MITSSSNPRLKRARLLLQSGKRRRAENIFVLEGARLIEDALGTGVKPEYILYSANASETSQALIQQAVSLPLVCLEVETELFEELSDTQNSQGILAVCPQPDLPLPTPLNLALILDHVADPGNMGTILRTAAAVGVDAVIIAPHGVDPTNPKVVRGAMGAHFRVPIRRWGWAQIETLGVPLVMADAQGSQTIYEKQWQAPLGLVIGGETRGFAESAYALTTEVVRIPMVAGESLNAAVATSVILYELYRQNWKQS